jgi:hypothetical protein
MGRTSWSCSRMGRTLFTPSWSPELRGRRCLRAARAAEGVVQTRSSLPACLAASAVPGMSLSSLSRTPVVPSRLVLK